jgi:molybdenum cofactor cytidylyltransferase
MTTAAIILAAGSSSRMGESKQMLDIHGQKLLVKTVKTVLNSGIDNVVVVLGSNERAHRDLIAGLSVYAVHHPEWEKGIGSSIKRGLVYITSKPSSPEAIIILVCDQPLLRSEHLAKLQAKYEETRKPIIASRYGQTPGVPALFHKSYYESLLALPDEQGAKKILLQNRHDVYEIDFPEGQIDLDTKADYESFLDGTS